MPVIKKLEAFKDDIVSIKPSCNHLLGHPERLSLIGSSGSGKSNLIGNLLTDERLYGGFFSKIIVISPNFLSDLAYEHIEKYSENLERKFKHELIAFTHFDEETMMELLDEIKEEVADGKERFKKSKAQDKSKFIPRTLILLDDIIEDNNLLNSKFLKLLATRGRHLNLSTWIASQSYMALPRIWRVNTTKTIFFQPKNTGEALRIYDELFKFYTKEEYFKLLEEIFKEKFSFILLTPSARKNKFLNLNFEYYIEKV